MDQVKFLRARPENAAAIRQLVRIAYAKWIPITGREPKPMTADYECAIHDHIIDMMLMNEKMVGLIELAPEPDCILIKNVAVEPSEWGKGYGRKLMMHAVDVTRFLGKDRIRLYTNKLMAQNITLYKSLGYGIDREERTPEGRDVVHMSTTV